MQSNILTTCDCGSCKLFYDVLIIVHSLKQFSLFSHQNKLHRFKNNIRHFYIDLIKSEKMKRVKLNSLHIFLPFWSSSSFHSLNTASMKGRQPKLSTHRDTNQHTLPTFYVEFNAQILKIVFAKKYFMLPFLLPVLESVRDLHICNCKYLCNLQITVLSPHK